MVTAGNGAFRYKISDKPEGLLIDTKDGFIVVKATATDTITMEAVVLTPLKDDFHIELYAYDRDNAPSDNPVKFTFGAILPYIGHYSVDQATNGKVATIKGVEKALRIGNRLDVPHEITVTGDAFTVATEKIADLNPVSGKVRVNPNSPPDGAGALCNADFSIPKWSSSTALGEECYSIASSSASILKITGFSVTNKIITFQLPSKNRSVSATGKPVITITYHVWALSSGIDGTTEPFPTTGRTRVTAAMKIPVDIHRMYRDFCLSTRSRMIGEAIFCVVPGLPPVAASKSGCGRLLEPRHPVGSNPPGHPGGGTFGNRPGITRVNPALSQDTTFPRRDIRYWSPCVSPNRPAGGATAEHAVGRDLTSFRRFPSR